MTKTQKRVLTYVMAFAIGTASFLIFSGKAHAYASNQYGTKTTCHENWYTGVPVGHCDMLLQIGTVHDDAAWINAHAWEIAPIIGGLFLLACAPLINPILVGICTAVGGAEAGVIADRIITAANATSKRCLDLRFSNFGTFWSFSSSKHPPASPLLVNGEYHYQGNQGCNSPYWWSFPMNWPSSLGSVCWMTKYQSQCGII